MKFSLLIYVLIAAIVQFTAISASAQLTWGTNGSGGSGTWDSSTANWYNGTSNVAWVSGDTGTFAGTAGIVSISSGQLASGLVFSSTTGSYTLTGGGLSGVIAIETNSDAVINTALYSSGTLTKTGTAVLTLGGSNSFTALDINAGTVGFSTGDASYYSHPQPLGTGTITLGVAGTSSGTLAFNATGSLSFQSVGTITVQGNGSDTISTNGSSGTYGILEINGTISINHTALTFSQTPSSSISIATYGSIIATSDSVLNIETPVELVNVYNVIQTINITGSFGLLGLSKDNDLPSTATINIASTLELGLGSSSGISQTLASITGNGKIFNYAHSGVSNLTINNDNPDTFDGRLGLVSGTQPYNNFSLTKTGTGVLTLTGTNNTYNGGTTVVSGTLIAANSNGSATGSGSLTVNSGATIGGSGQFNSSNTVINGNVQAGMGSADTTSILTMTSSGSTTFNNANLVFNLNAATPGQGNELALGATPSVLFSTTSLTLNVQNINAALNGTQYLLLTSTGTGTGIGGSIFGGDITYDSATGIISGLGLTINGAIDKGSYLKLVADGGGYDIDLIVYAVPEPGTWVFLLSGMTLLGLWRFRKYGKA